MGKHTRSFAELVDIYPTLADLAELPAPTDPLEGQSLASYFDDPGQASVKKAAFSQYPRCPRNLSKVWDENSCHEVTFNPLLQLSRGNF